MKCPWCQADNPSRANFCLECGTPLKPAGQGLPPEASYADLQRELTDAVGQQTATSEILRVISQSQADVQPVFDTILANALRLCEAHNGGIFTFDGQSFRMAAAAELSDDFLAYLREAVILPGAETPLRRVALEPRVNHVADILADPSFSPPEVYRLEGIRTSLAVPMLKEGRLVGALAFHRRQVRPFTEKQIALITTFADQAVMAIENARLFEALETRTRELAQSLEEVRALGEVTQTIDSSLDLHRVLDTVIRHAVTLSGSDAGLIVEFTPSTRSFADVASHSLSETFLEAMRKTPVDPEQGVVRRITESGRPLQIPAVEEAHDFFLREIMLREGLRALLTAPIPGENITRGIVVFRRASGLFDERVVQLLVALAIQSKVAIDNARLFQEVQSQQERLEQLSRNQEQIYRLSTAMQEPLSLREQLHRVLEAASQMGILDRIYVWAVSLEADRLVNLAGAGFSADEWKDFDGAEIPLVEAGAMYKAYQEGVPLLFNESNPLPRELSLRPPYSELRGVRTRNFLVVPMIAKGVTLGVLAGDNKPSGRPIAPHTVNLLQTFAAHAAVAIANARLFQAIEEKSRQLEVANRHKSEFLANMSHELRTPLNAVIGFSEVLLERMFGEINDKQTEYLQDILSSGRHLLSLINDILDLSKIEAGRMELALASFHLPQALDNAVTLVKERAARHGIALHVDVDGRLGEIIGDERKIKQVLLNLLSNAVKFTPERGRISLRAVLADGAVEVSVSDTGVGIAPEDQGTIFEEFRQVGRDDARKHEGTGLGLTLTKKFVEMHGGRIWVESAVGRGSTFTFTLPIRS
jgi:signal transduction histidine kinase